MSTITGSDLRENTRTFFGKLLEIMAVMQEVNTGLETHSPKEGDVFVASFPKSGTTLMQNMMYSIVVESGGAPACDPTGTGYTDIGEVVPWVDDKATKPWPSKPRLFKTHMPVTYFDMEDKRTRYIYCFRNGLHIPASFLDFTVEWICPGIELTDEDRQQIFSKYLSGYFLAPAKRRPGEYTGVGRWFQHVRGWTEPQRENVLILNYEAMCNDLVGTIQTVAHFMGLDISADAVQRVAAKCDRAVMARDEKFREKMWGRNQGWDPNGGMKVRMPGNSGFRSIAFTVEERFKYDELFKDTFGVDNFAALIEHLEKRDATTSLSPSNKRAHGSGTGWQDEQEH